jgi:hypothetical protein
MCRVVASGAAMGAWGQRWEWSDMSATTVVARVNDATKGPASGSAGVTVGTVGVSAVCALTFSVFVAPVDGVGVGCPAASTPPIPDIPRAHAATFSCSTR